MPKLDIQNFVYISVICKATSVRSSVGLKYQLECDKVQQLQTHCGHALFFGGKSLYKDILFLCPQWGSGPYISRNFLIWTHFVNASWKKAQPTHAHCCNHFIPVHARITRAYSHMLQDNKLSIFLFITWRPTRGSGLHSFESFSFVNIALSRFIS